MKPALVMKALAIFAVTSLVRCVPVENHFNAIAERDAAEENPYCVKFFEDTYLKAPFQGVSSVAPSPEYPSYCRFYSSNDCSGEFRSIVSGQTVLDFVNWNDNISSYVCDHEKPLNPREDTGTSTTVISTDTEHNGIAEGNTEFCTHFYEHIHFQGINTVLCDKQKQCLPVPSFGVSSINPNPSSCGTCQFYRQPGCAGDFIEIRTIQNIEDLSDSAGFFLGWNDALKSFSCDVKFCGATSNSLTDAGSLNSDHQAKEIAVRSSTKLAEHDVSDISARVPTQDQVQTSTDRIDVSLYTDTQFHGSWIDLSTDVNTCAKITKSDGSGHNFELSSARLNTHNTTSDNQINLAYCKFYKGKNCEENTWAFTIGNNSDAPDLNDISQLKRKGLENNVNDKVWSTSCIWDVEVRRRDLPHTTTDFSQVPAPKPEVPGPHPTKWVPGIPYGMLIYPKRDYQGDPLRAWIEPGQCYYIDYSGPNVGLLHPLWSYGSIKMDRLPQWILDMRMDIRCTFTSASWCEYPLFNRDSTHNGDLSHVSGTVNGYWCEWYKV